MILSFQVGQGDLGLGQRNYYVNDTPVNAAYQKFMRDLAMALANDTTMVEQDVKDMYAFEKNLAQVALFLSFCLSCDLFGR